MKHLSEEQLVAILYQDPIGTNVPEDEKHLEACGECRAALSELQGVMEMLGQATPCPSADRKLDRQRLTNDCESVISSPYLSRDRDRFWQSSWFAWTAAASLLFVVVTGSFVVGRSVGSQDTAKMLAEFETRISQQLSDESAQARAIAEQDHQNYAGQVNRVVGQLFDQQTQLHDELQSLALNVESELLTTKREIGIARAALQELQQLTGIAW